jgi:NHL repeat
MERAENPDSAHAAGARDTGAGSGVPQRVGRTARRALLPRSRQRAVFALALLLAGGVLGLTGTPAMAFSERGHEFAFTFGSTGTARGQFAEKVGPTGVAVSESTGDVYVVDPGNSRVEQFGPEGEPIAVWGWGVTDEKPEYEVCTLGCHKGIAGTGEGQFQYPAKFKAGGLERPAIGIAVDNSTSGGDPSKGDVYVVSDTVSEPNVVQKFGPNGEFINRVKLSPAGNSVGGLAVDAGGALWVEAGFAPFVLQEPEQFNNEVENKLLSLVELIGNEVDATECGTPGFAVDAQSQTLYANHERLSIEQELCTPEEEELIQEEKKEFKKGEIEHEPTREAERRIVTAKFQFTGTPPATLVTPALDHEETTAVAVDEPSGDVYLDNVGTVAVFKASGAFVQRFGEKHITTGVGVGVNGGGGAGGGNVYVADWKKARVAVFELEGVGAPMIDSLSAIDLEPTATELKASIDPHGQETSYTFEYGTTNCALPGAGCTKIEGTVPAGFGDVHVTAVAEGLEPATTYFYRLVAVNASGQTEFPASPESERLHTFTTLPQAAGLLPDNRKWELVSPTDKAGATLEAIGGVGGGPTAAPSVGIIQASPDGARLAYSANTATEKNVEGNRAPEAQQIIAQRGEQWTSKDIQTPLARGTGLAPGQSEEYRAFSENLSLAMLRPPGVEGSQLEEPALVSEGENRNIFLRENFNPACEAPKATCFKPLVTKENATNPAFGTQFQVLGATPDLNHVIFRAKESTPLVAGATGGSLYEWNAGVPAGEQLKVVNVLPSGEVRENPGGNESEFGGEREQQADDARNAVSADGSRVFWAGGSKELYVRDMVGGRTLEVSKAEPGVSAPDTETDVGRVARFQTASTNGEFVFFTDTAPLTGESLLHLRATSESGNPPADLYACRIVEESGELKCRLKDLTVDVRSNIGEEARVTPLILGASNDGTYVYFVAGGALAPGAKAGACAEEGFNDTCNLYVDHYNQETEEWEAPKLVARLSEEDDADWGSSLPKLYGVSSRVSPNGHFLAFMSNQSLTGYNNEDAVSGAADEEVFLYDAIKETVTCVSCNPTGEQPVGVLDELHTSEGNGLLVDRPNVWLGKTLAGSVPTWTFSNERTTLYQSRYLNDEGRLFFNSPDQLVTLPEGEEYVRKENVYEYEPAGAGGSLGTCTNPSGCVALLSAGTSDHESAFLDASADGSSVFFLTAERLVVADHDESLDIYSARECSAESPCLSGGGVAPRECETTNSCHGGPTPAPTFEGSTLGGTGNVAKVINREEPSTKPKTGPSRAELLKKALKKCHKLKKRKKRHACERAAKKRYAAKKASHHRGTRR